MTIRLLLYSPMKGVKQGPLFCIRPNYRASTRSVKTSTVDWKPIKSSTTNITKKEENMKNPYLRKFFLSLMVAMPVISFGLGCWQVQRLDWKTKLIAKSEHMLSLEPIDLPKDIDPEKVADFEYRRVILEGHFDYDNELFLGPRLKDGEMGYRLITPLIRSEGKPILVDRGWISKAKVIPANRENGYLAHLARPSGNIKIQALLRVMPQKSALQYDHEKGSRQFFVPDVEAMAEQTGSLPIFCQAIYDMKDHPEWKQTTSNSDEKSIGFKKWFGKRKQDNDQVQDEILEYENFQFVNEGVPIGTVPKVTFTNNHLQYLVTWFGVSLFSGGLLIYSLRKGNGGAEKAIEAKRRHMKNLM